jgi:PHD/YefM family antitoxin component YafN of YafNO toxin-antitoxin module
MTVKQAQSSLPKLCRQGKPILVTNRQRPVSVLLSVDDYEAMIETMDLLSNPKAMRAIRAAKAGKPAYRDLDLDDENFGL